MTPLDAAQRLQEMYEGALGQYRFGLRLAIGMFLMSVAGTVVSLLLQWWIVAAVWALDLLYFGREIDIRMIRVKELEEALPAIKQRCERLRKWRL